MQQLYGAVLGLQENVQVVQLHGVLRGPLLHPARLHPAPALLPRRRRPLATRCRALAVPRVWVPIDLSEEQSEDVLGGGRRVTSRL